MLKPIIFLVVVLICAYAVYFILAIRTQDAQSFENPERKIYEVGSGERSLNYLVMGDSTVAGKGAEYNQGIALQTAQQLVTTHNSKVSLYNTAISGARFKDVATEQLKAVSASDFKPDFVLVMVGSNDSTHLTSLSAIKSTQRKISEGLIKINCQAKIVFTGSADMGAPPRIPQPLRGLAGVRSGQINTVVEELVREQGLTFALVATETGPLFRKDKLLFSTDKFHPNADGYNVMSQTINEALARAGSQPSHCE